MSDRLPMLYIAVWKSNNWPWVRNNFFVGRTKKSVLEQVEKVDSWLLKKVRVIKYVPSVH
jgi:hypothetical protein